MIHAVLVSLDPSSDHHLHHHASCSSLSSPSALLSGLSTGPMAKEPSECRRYQPLPQHANVKPFFKSDATPLAQLIRLFLEKLPVSSRPASIDIGRDTLTLRIAVRSG